MTAGPLVIVPDRWAMLAMFARPRHLRGPRPLRVLLPSLEYLDVLRVASPLLGESRESGNSAPVELLLGAAVARERLKRRALRPDTPNWAFLLHPSVLCSADDDGETVEAAVVHVESKHLPLLAALQRWSPLRPRAASLITASEAELLLVARLHRATIVLDESRHSIDFPTAIERELVARVPLENGQLILPW